MNIKLGMYWYFQFRLRRAKSQNTSLQAVAQSYLLLMKQFLQEKCYHIIKKPNKILPENPSILFYEAEHFPLTLQTE